MNVKGGIRFILDSTGLSKRKINIVITICVISAFVHTGMGVILMPLIDYSVMKQKGIVWEYILIFIIFVLTNEIFQYIRKTGFNNLSLSSELYITKKVTDSLISKQMSYFENNEEGEIIQYLNKRIKEYSCFLLKNLENFFFKPFDFFFTFIGVCVVNMKIGIIIFTIIMVCAYCNYKLCNRMIHSSKKLYQAENEVMNYQKEMMEDYDNICMSDLECYVIGIHEKKINNMLDKANALTKESQKAYIPALINEYLPTIFFLFLSIIEIYQRNMSYGSFASLLALINGVSLPVTYYLYSFTKLKSWFPFMEEFYSICTEEDKKDDFVKIKLVQNQPIVCLQEVSFSYGKEPLILENFTFHVSQGDKMAIIGKSGLGKSTILKIIMGFYEPISGSIKVFGLNAFEHQKVLWEHIAYVDNNNYFFDGSIKYNITLLDRELSLQEKNKYDDICKLLGLQELEEKGDSLQQFGKNFSGGQRLRISLARALYRDAKLFILDEPVSSFDKETEKIICNFIANTNYTVILTTHRMELLRVCNKILKLENEKYELVEKE